MKSNQQGAVPVLVLIAVLGILGGFVISNFFDFKYPPLKGTDPKPQAEAKGKKEKKVKKADKNRASLPSPDNRFYFEFNNPSDAQNWVPQIDVPYYLWDTGNWENKRTPTTSSIENLRVEEGYLKFKVKTHNTTLIKGPRNLNIPIEQFRDGLLSQAKTGEFRIRAKSDGSGDKKDEKYYYDTGGVQIWLYYNDPDNPIDKELPIFYAVPVYRFSTIHSLMTFNTFHDAGGWERYPEDTNKFLGPSAYITGIDIRTTSFKDQEIWIDYLGFMDSYPTIGNNDKDWGVFGTSYNDLR